MEPGIHQGDLILARAPDDYRIGDIAAYQNKSVGKVVLHRIISRDADLFTLKGDNNSFIDEYRPTRLDLIGVPWVLIPGAGNILLWLATPLHAALVVGAFFFVMLGGLAFFVKKRRRLGRKSLPAKKQLRFPVPSPSRTVHSELLALGSLAVFALAVGFAWFASTRPAMKTEFTNVQYEQRAGFHYSAEVEPGPIYDNPQISTGDPVFLRLVRELVVEFNYELDSQFPHGISGTGRLILEISDTNGWIRQRALQTETSFVGDTLSLSGTIDLAELEKVFEDFVDLTGLNRQSFVLRVIAEVQADGLVAGQPCCDVFAPDPQLVFSLDPLQLILTPGSADQVEVVQPGTVKVARLEPNYLRFLVADLEVDSARKYAVLTVPFLMALIATSFFYRLPPEDEPSRIEQDYGHLLVLAERLDFPQHHFRLRQMKSLVRLAERFDCVILHSAEGRVHTYLIYEGSAAYIYQAAGRNEGGSFESDDSENIAA